MDFELDYSEEQEEFRKEVRAWLETHVPRVELPPDSADLTQEHYEIGKAFRRDLGAKGWLAPTWPKEFGGGGLTADHAVVINEELARYDIPPLGDLGLVISAPAILVHGTDEQKQRYLPEILKGHAITWQVFTEPDAGSDLASLKTRGVRDGDDYLINGQKQFVGTGVTPDYLYTLVNTDPTGPRHENLSAFMVPAESKGVTIQNMDLIAGGTKRFVFFDNVRVPADTLIGRENEGWWVAQTTVSLEGGSGIDDTAYGRVKLLDLIIQYLREGETLQS
ncbi:MAG TPA: acyl-CoA dehydrogenase family protein [Dehalococcoidia bacterium]|nr:acyl-CoA dehydrogenase family protein [Dehalococcoidia bacterium]